MERLSKISLSLKGEDYGESDLLKKEVLIFLRRFKKTNGGNS